MNQPILIDESALAAEVCSRFRIEATASELLKDGMTQQEFLAALLEQKEYSSGIDFLAHALPARQGIWWGCLCMQHALEGRLSPLDQDAARAAVAWVLEPSEERRLAAKAMAEPAGSQSPAGVLAKACALTAGSIYPPELPFKAPPAFAPQREVARAVRLASLRTKETAKARRAYVEMGLKAAEGNLI